MHSSDISQFIVFPKCLLNMNHAIRSGAFWTKKNSLSLWPDLKWTWEHFRISSASKKNHFDIYRNRKRKFGMVKREVSFILNISFLKLFLYKAYIFAQSSERKASSRMKFNLLVWLSLSFVFLTLQLNLRVYYIVSCVILWPLTFV